MIRKMYKYAINDEKADEYIDKIRSVSGEASSKITLKIALFNP